MHPFIISIYLEFIDFFIIYSRMQAQGKTLVICDHQHLEMENVIKKLLPFLLSIV